MKLIKAGMDSKSVLAKIPKRDDRSKTIDVHSLRHTFATMLSTSGTNLRVAQAAMRHSDPRLTATTYTDEKLLNVRSAIENLPSFSPPTPSSSEMAPKKSVLDCAPETGKKVPKMATAGKNDDASNSLSLPAVSSKKAGKVNEKCPESSSDNSGHHVGVAGFEPTTSCAQGKRHTQDSPAKQADSDGVNSGCPTGCPSETKSAPDLTAILVSLASLSTDQRNAILALLGSSSPTSSSKSSFLDDRLPWEREGGQS